MCSLAINIASLSQLLKRVDFDAIVDHLALTHIIESKVEPATIRIKRLLELISSYSFNVYYIKGKDMILSDFLSRQKHDNSHPHEIISISFNMHSILHKRYYDIGLTDRIFSTNLITDKIPWDKTTRVSWSKEKFKPKFTT